MMGDAEMPGQQGSYAVITPVRDEVRNFPRMVSSMIDQTLRPESWVIVDDGSTDGTRELAEGYAAAHDWISVVDSGQMHARGRGGHVVHAFNAGLAALDSRPPIIAKLDGDLYLPAHYFEWVIAAFARERRAGIIGGVVLDYDGARWVEDNTTGHTVRGAVKTYRTECLEEIGGLRATMGWDGLDAYAARARDWEVYVLSELHVLHYSPRGSKQPWYQSRWEEGLAAQAMGYLPQFLALRVLFRLISERPRIIGALVMAAGYTVARLRGDAQIDDRMAIVVLRREQRERLRGFLRGRRGAVPTTRLVDRGPAFWSDGRLPSDRDSSESGQSPGPSPSDRASRCGGGKKALKPAS